MAASSLRNALAAAAVLTSTSVFASAFEIDARTEAQLYEFRSYSQTSPDDPVLIARRRLVQYLGLAGFELLPGEDFGFESSLRVFDDLGLSPQQAKELDGPRALGADLLYAFARYRKGGLEAELGRQIYIDVLDYMAFDGARVRYVSRFGVGAEAYAGLWVKGASFLGSSVYQPDGTRETDQRRLALGSPSADPYVDQPEPVFGAKIFAERLFGFDASVGYRKSFIGGETSLERASAEIRYLHPRGLNGGAGVDVDVIWRQLAQARGELRYDGNLFAVSGQATRLAPVLSAESIWYYFATAPRDEARLRVDLLPDAPLRFYAQGLASKANTNLNSTLSIAQNLSGAPTPYSWAASAGGAVRANAMRASIDGTWRNGYGGRQLWIDVNGGYEPIGRWLTMQARLSFASIVDGLNPLLEGNFYGAQLWTTYRIGPSMQVSLILEENVSARTRSDFKAFALYELKAWAG